MPLDVTLARVEDDLVRGELAMAKQRLRSLVDAFPRQLDLRVRLADVYRALGEPAEAGRWRYLSPPRDGTDQAEIDAFVRSEHDRANAIAVKLHHRGRVEEITDAYVRERLRSLRDQALRQDGDWIEYDEDGTSHRRMSATHRLLVGLVVVVFASFLTGLLAASVWGLYVLGRLILRISA